MHQRILGILTLVAGRNSPNLVQLLLYCADVDKDREACMFICMAFSLLLHVLLPSPNSRLFDE